MNNPPSDRDLALLCAATEAKPSPAWAFAGPTFHATMTSVAAAVVALACEGSESFADWATDFDVFGFGTLDHPDLGLVHEGFNASSDECFPEIVRAVEGKRVILTGHSKGGANAEEIAAKLTVAGAKVIRLVTFGTPRWVYGGNPKIARLLPPSLGLSYRRLADVVTEAPFPPFDHPMTRPAVHVGRAASFRDLLDVEAMHSIAGYAADVPG